MKRNLILSVVMLAVVSLALNSATHAKLVNPKSELRIIAAGETFKLLHVNA